MLKDDMLLYRAKNNISQTELAKRAGLTVQTINNVENGHQNPSKLTEAKIRMIIGSQKED